MILLIFFLAVGGLDRGTEMARWYIAAASAAVAGVLVKRERYIISLR